jgi:hypothetical protein
MQRASGTEREDEKADPTAENISEDSTDEQLADTAFTVPSKSISFPERMSSTFHTGALFKSATMEMKVGKQYKLSDIVEYKGKDSRGSATIYTAPCNVTARFLRGKYSGTLRGTTDMDEWGISSPQGFSPNELEKSWIKFDSDECLEDGGAYLYSGEDDWEDIIRINLTRPTQEELNGEATEADAGAEAVDLSPCRNLAVDTLEKDIKGLLLGSTISSGVGALSSAAGAVTGGIGMSAAKDESKKDAAGKLQLASTITSAVGAAGAAGGAITSGIALSKLDDVIKGMKECRAAADRAGRQ